MMKKNSIKTITTLVLVSLFSCVFSQNQTTHNHSNHDEHDHEYAEAGVDDDGNLIDAFRFQTGFDADSISGFNEDAAIAEAKLYYKKDWQIKRYVALLKRNFIDYKYNFKSVAPLPTPQAPCTNPDFETGSLAGWTTSQGPNNNSQTMAGCCPTSPSGQIVVVTPGNDPNLGATLPRVPPGGGNFAARLGPTGAGSGGTSYRLSQMFNVTAANSVFIYRYAAVLNAAPHTCSEQPFFNITFRDCNNNPIPCGQFQEVAQSSSCSSGNTSYVTSGSWKYLPWQTRSFDLTAYIGQCVEIEFTVAGCVASQGAHGGYAYVDASCQPMTLRLNGTDIPVGQTNSFICAGGTNTLCAPSGFTSYNWTGPGVTGQTGQCVNPSTTGSYSVTLGMAGTSCNSPMLYSNFSIVPKPIADFNFTVTPCQSTFTVPFASNSNLNGGPAISSFNWTWGDGTPNGSNANETHTFATAGNKTVKLKISNGGCSDSITKTITVSSGPLANFNTQNNCLGVLSTFTSATTPTTGIASQVWTWGDGTPNGSGASVNHNYGSAGTYSVKLVVTAVGLCKDSIIKPITIHPKPNMSFTTSPVCLGSVTNFINNSTISAPNTISSWSWDFDNNGIVDNSSQTPSNTYSVAGTYSVELKGTSSQGCVDSIVRTIKVNALPTATFALSPACLNANITINNMSSIPLPDNITTYNWNFGSGALPSSSTVQNPSTLIYNSGGVKTITLSVTANTGCSSSITTTVEVFPQPVANFSSSAVCQGSVTNYTDLSTTSVGSITGWSWDYTNNGSSDANTQNPTNSFASSGNYTTALIVTSSNGCKDTITLPVIVYGRAIPDFTPNNVCYGTASTFSNQTDITTNLNVGSNPTYQWDFADGSALSSAQNPNHTYNLGSNANAVYNVTLTVTTQNNCIDRVVKPVRVFAVPTASFTADSVCLGSPTSFVDASNGNGNIVNGFMWDFLADGTVDLTGISNPQHVFPNHGVNLVSYTVSTTPTLGLVCQNSNNSLTVFIHPKPVADFSFTNKCINEQPILFDGTASSIVAGSITNYNWAYGNGLTNSGVTTSYNYSTPGTYSVTLQVTSNKGCQAIVIKPVSVFPKPQMSILNTQACDGRPVTFNANSLSGSGNVTNWNWDFNSSITSFEAQGQTTNYTFPSAGNYTVALVSITDNGCKDTISLPFYVDYVPVPEFSVNRPSGCPEHCVVFSDLTPQITGPGQNAEWKWYLGDGTVITSNNNNTQSHCYTNSSTSQSALFDVKLVVTTDRGCKDSLIKTSYITVYPVPIAAYTASPNPANVVEPFIQFTNQSSDYTKWWWSFGDGPLVDSINVSPFHEYSDVSANNYYSSLIVQNQYGCKDTAYLKIEITPEFTFYIPNAFTPHNDDGINDYFTGIGIGIEKYEMWIFDRWGEMIYYSDDIKKGWNGKVQGKEQECKQDVYVWKVKIKDVLGKKHDYIGHVTLLR